MKPLSRDSGSTRVFLSRIAQLVGAIGLMLFGTLQASSTQSGPSTSTQPSNLSSPEDNDADGPLWDPIPIDVDEVRIFNAQGNEIRRMPVRRASAKAGKPKLYFLWPLMALETTTPSLPGQPGWVFKAEPQSDGMVLLRLKVVLFDEKYVPTATRLIEQSDADYLAAQPASQPVIVRRWPVTAAYVNVNDAFGRQLAKGWTGAVTNSPDDVWVTLTLAPQNAKAFYEAANRNELQFNWTIQYVGTPTRVLVRTLEGSQDVVVRAMQLLSTDQTEGKAPIFQQQATEVKRAITSNLYEDVTGGDPSLLLATTNLSGIFTAVFEPEQQMTLTELKEAYGPESEQALARYLAPLIKTITDKKSGNSIEVDLHQTQESKSQAGELSISIPVLNAGVSKEERDEVLDSVEQQTGVAWEQGSDARTFVPQSVSCTKLRAGAQSVQVDIRQQVFIAMPGGSKSMTDYSVPEELTDVLEREMAANYLLSAAVADLQAVRDGLRTDLAAIQHDLDSSRHTVLDLRKSIAALQSDLGSTNAQLAAKSAQLDQLTNLLTPHHASWPSYDAKVAEELRRVSICTGLGMPLDQARNVVAQTFVGDDWPAAPQTSAQPSHGLPFNPWKEIRTQK